MKSIFTDKEKIPNAIQLKIALENTTTLWNNIVAYTTKLFPDAKVEWKYSGEKFGWSFRLSDKKRVLIYLLPRDEFFKVAFVFGQKAFQEVIKSKISDSIKTELQEAKVYAEGRGIRLEVKSKSILPEILKLIEIKIKF